jgi:peptide/nickel transport system permease protein
MIAFLAKRLLLTIPTLIGVAIAVFFLIRVVPGDAVTVKLRADGAAVTPETIAAERKRLGLDKPLITLSGCAIVEPVQCFKKSQFGEYMYGLARGDLGRSIWQDQYTVNGLIWDRFPVSFQIAIMATIIAILIAIPLGLLSAIYRDTWVDYLVRIIAVSGLAIPSFWLGMLIIMALLAAFNWLPRIEYVSFFKDPIANLSQLIWPALAVGYRYAAVATRMMRSALLEVLREDYIRTARAKGLFEKLVTRRHALRNALLPVVTVIGLEFAFLIGGLVVTEQVFSINGIGKLLLDAVTRGDVNLIQGIVLLTATIFIIVNLIVDLLYAALDPRIRLS